MILKKKIMKILMKIKFEQKVIFEYKFKIKNKYFSFIAYLII